MNYRLNVRFRSIGLQTPTLPATFDAAVHGGIVLPLMSHVQKGMMPVQAA